MKRPFPFHSNLVWPAPGLVGAFVVIYGLVSVYFWLIAQTAPEPARSTFDVPEAVSCCEIILGFTAALYATYRLLRFHPACNPGYSRWLKLSPWTADRPLPAGPVHLVWQDAVVVGALAAIGIWQHVNPLLPVTAFIFVYLAWFTVLLAFTRRWGSCLALGFLWPSLMLPGIAPVPPTSVLPAICVVAAMAYVIWYGYRQSLKAFPWDFIKTALRSRRSSRSALDIEVRIPSAAGTLFELGWPFFVLSPKILPPTISPRTNLALGALAGWWSFCIIKASQMDPLPEIIVLLTIVAATFRLLIYAAGAAAPFNILGRIATGRIIVPGYDKIYATPLAVVVAAMLGGIIIKRSGAWYPETESIVIAILWWVLFGGGPTLRNWALTGQFRRRAPAIVNSNRQMIKQV
jgi:hypothetical protein